MFNVNAASQKMTTYLKHALTNPVPVAIGFILYIGTIYYVILLCMIY